MKEKLFATAMALIAGFQAMAQDSKCSSLVDQQLEYMNTGNIAKAIDCGEKAKSCLDKELADKHAQDYFDVMTGLAQCYQATGKYEKSKQCYLDLLEVMENAGDTTTNFYLALISSVPTSAAPLKDFKTCMEYYNKLLNSMAYKEGISLGSCGEQGWQCITGKAIKILKQAPGWKVASFDDNYAFSNLGNNLVACSESKLAIDLLEETCSQMRQKNLAQAECFLPAISSLATAYTNVGNHEKEYVCYSEAYSLSKALRGEADMNTQHLKNMLSRLKSYAADPSAAKGKKGDKNSADYNIDQFWVKYNSSLYQEASEYGKKALQLLRKQENTNPESMVMFLNTLGNCMSITGKPQEAIDFYNEVLGYLQDNGMGNSLQASVIMQNIATIYTNLIDYDNEAHYRASGLRIMAGHYGIDYPKSGHRTKADEIVAISEAIISKLGKLDDKQAEEVMTAIIGSSNLLLETGRKQDYENLFNSMMETLDETIGRNNIAGFLLVRQMGIMHWDSKEYPDALRYFEAAELVAIQMYGNNSYEHAQVLSLLSNTQALLKRYENQLENLSKAADILKICVGEQSSEYIQAIMDIARVYIRTNDFSNAAAYLEKWFGLLKNQIRDLFDFMTIQEKTAYYEKNIEPFTNDFFILAQNFDKIQKSQGIFYDYELLCKGMLLSSETEFNNYIRNCDNPETQELYAQYRKNGEFIKAQSQKPEATRDPRYNDIRIENSNIGHRLITESAEAADLSQNISISWLDVKKALQKNDVAIEFMKSANNMYQALVISPKLKVPEAVPLFEERELKKEIAKGTDKDCDFMYMPYESTVMYQIVWKRLEKYLSPGCKVYFAPKGIIHTMAIEYAPIGGDSIFCNRYQVQRISSTRNLAMKARSAENKNAAVYGGIEYSYGLGEQGQASEGSGGLINFLPGTLKEMSDIGDCLMESGVNITKYSGRYATAESMLGLSGANVNILHIATHGIFQESGSNSLDNSGLAMADQILTSSKISDMNLASANLVVLSACETARGNVTSEGVFGLQRAFKLAGAKSILMSLWPVNDQSTRMLMIDFYNNIYKNGMSKRDAFYKAVDSLRSRPGTTPFNWAAFIMLD